MKQREIGLIPEDWEVVTVRDLITLLTDYDANGSFSSVAENVKSYNHPEYAWYVRSTDLENKTSISNVKYVDKSSYEFLKKTSLFGGELLFLKRGDIGNVYLFEMKTNRATLAPNLYLLKLNSLSSSKYLYQYFISENGQKQLKSKNAGSTLGALYKDDVKSMLVPLPHLAEQEAIANALSDADVWIGKLAQLIAKKRLIKLGAMQNLLTPKDGWEEVDFNKVVWFQEGPGLRNWQFTKSGIKVINVTNLENGYLNLSKTSRHISIEEYERMYKHFLIDEGDVVVASSGNSYGKLAIVRSQDLPLLMNTSVIRFKPLNGITYLYMLVFLKSNLFKDQIDLLITGGAQPNFGPAHLNKLKITKPKSLSEQERIATILSDMDTEIEALELQLGKARHIKQGMMQVMLTGRTRLV